MSNVDVLVIQISGPLCGKHQMILWLSLLHPDPSPFLTHAIRKVNRGKSDGAELEHRIEEEVLKIN